MISNPPTAGNFSVGLLGPDSILVSNSLVNRHLQFELVQLVKFHYPIVHTSFSSDFFTIWLFFIQEYGFEQSQTI